MAIKEFKGDLASIDNTFGYNDMILMPPGGEGLPIRMEDTLHEAGMPLNALVTQKGNPSKGISDEVAEGLVRSSDKLFRLPNGGILLRRSVFSDPCLFSEIDEKRTVSMSEDLARAVGYFQAGGVVSDAKWCRAQTPGVAGGMKLVTPFNLSSPDDVRTLRRILREIRDAREGDVENPGLDTDMAKTLADAVSEEELKNLDQTVEDLFTAEMNPVEWAVYQIHQLPWYLYVPADLLGVAVSTALIAGIFHYVSKWLTPPPPPPPPPPPSREDIAETVGKELDKRGLGNNAAERAENDPDLAQAQQALDDSYALVPEGRGSETPGYVTLGQIEGSPVGEPAPAGATRPVLPGAPVRLPNLQPRPVLRPALP
ncbi:MAG TPA: hypothetical protein VFX30_12920 [bacterium]|nr:hypothetical protein [bacterium]